MSRALPWLVGLSLVLLVAACEKDYDYDDDTGPPVITISSPSVGQAVCATVEASFTATGSRNELVFTCAIDDEAPAPCTSPLTTFELLAAGPHTLTVFARNDVGSDQVSVEFEVDGVAPSVDLTPSAGAVNTGTATLTVAVLDGAEGTSVEAGVELRIGDAEYVTVPGSCTCTGPSCACTGLAAGENWLQAQVTDACGNRSINSTNVNAAFGPYRGHAVLIGHDYSDDATPDVLGNAAAQVPFVVDDLDLGRASVRVLAWRPDGVPDEVVARAVASLEAGLGDRFEAAADYHELVDPAGISDYLPGRDVLLMYEPGAAFDDEQLDAIADQLAPRLAGFTAAGGVVIALSSDHGWRLLTGGDAPLIGIAAGYPVEPAAKGDLDPSFMLARYPATALGTAGYALLAGVDDDYPTPGGSGCVELADPSATVVAEHIGASCGDGCFYGSCDAIVDQRLPRYTIAVTPAFDVDPYPVCVPDGVGLDSDGTFTIDVGDGLPTPTGTFVCTHAPRPGYLTPPGPIEACTVTSQGDGSFAVTLASAPRNGDTYVDITLVDGGVPVRSGRVTVRVDDDMFVASGNVAANACAAGYLVREYRPSVTTECGASLPSYLAVQSVSCVLERQSAPGVFTQVASRTGAGCGAVPSAGGGFESNSYSVDWSGAIVAGNVSGTLRYTVTATDYHGNVDSDGRTWTLSSSTLCN